MYIDIPLPGAGLGILAILFVLFFLVMRFIPGE